MTQPSDKQLKLVIAISVLASFVAFLDGSVINVALPAIARNLGGGLETQQWIVDAYLITLGSLILLAGSLSDLFGRKRTLNAGLIGFGLASLLCTVAPTNTFLIVARGLQGVAGALLVPSSLALIISSFSGKAQGKAIGTWTAWTGMSFIAGPIIGGFLVDSLSWRYIFAINIIPIAICLWLLTKLTIEDAISKVKLDIIGALLCSFGLFSCVFALIEQSHYWTIAIGVLLLLGFGLYEKKINHPMLPLSLFKIRNFAAGNITTAIVYGGLSIATFLIVIFLQQVAGYTALAAGLSLLPMQFFMFFLSPQFGKLSGKYGPRLFMTFGPIIIGFGFLLMLRVSERVNYLQDLLPAICVFAFGLSMTVAPLTTAVLSDVAKTQSGIASAVNNAVSRIAGLVAIAALGVIIGGAINVDGFHRSLIFSATLMICGGVASAIGIRKKLY